MQLVHELISFSGFFSITTRCKTKGTNWRNHYTDIRFPFQSPKGKYRVNSLISYAFSVRPSKRSVWKMCLYMFICVALYLLVNKILSCPVLSCPTLPYPTLSYLSYPIPSHPIPSHPSHPIPSLIYVSKRRPVKELGHEPISQKKNMYILCIRLLGNFRYQALGTARSHHDTVNRNPRTQ